MSFRTMKLELQQFVSELNAVQCGVRLNRSQQQLLDMHPWSFLNTEALIKLYAPYTTGTVTVVNGSSTVTGAGTAWTSAHVGRYIKIFDSFVIYKISSVDAVAQTMVLEATYGEANAATQSYTIFQHIYSKPADCRNIVGIRYDYNLPETTKQYIDTLDPDRESTGEPYRWANIDNVTFEIWPVPDQNYTVRMWYRKAIADMAAETDVCTLPERLVLSHAVLSAYRQLAAKPEGQAYLQLIQAAQSELNDAWSSAVEEDMRKISLPSTVKDVDGYGLPTNDTWLLAHDPGDPRRF